jgi:cholesterol oxidase
VNPRPSVTSFEQMKGYFTVGDWKTVTDEDYERALRNGRRTNTYVSTRLRLTADDLERHLADPKHPMRIEGWIRADSLWGRAEITEGQVNVFVPTENPALDRMEYRFHFDGGDVGPLTLLGFKEVSESLTSTVLRDTQILYTRLFRGTIGWEDADTADVYAVGILNLYWRDFIRFNVLNLRVQGPNRLKWGWRFLKFFVGSNVRFQLMKGTGRRD